MAQPDEREAAYDDKVTESEQTTSPLQSRQTDVHPDLARRVARHLSHPWRKPIPRHTQRAAETVIAWLEEQRRPLLLDSFCGTGMSTAQLAQQHPQLAVVGVDQSAARLGRHGTRGNYLLLRAECEPFWQALVAAGVQAEKHYLLYPNPWPKPQHVKRRIHGHPGFAALLALGGRTELRSNWSVYVREFAAAMTQAGVSGQLDRLPPGEPLTLFEHKYRQRGHALWVWQGELGRSGWRPDTAALPCPRPSGGNEPCR